MREINNMLLAGQTIDTVSNGQVSKSSGLTDASSSRSVEKEELTKGISPRADF